MHIDAFTVLLFGLLIKVPLSVLFLWFWFSDRRMRWFAWWSATLFFGGLAGLFLLNIWSVSARFGGGVACLIASFACCWQGARAFEKRGSSWLPVVATPALWIAASLIPTFIETVSYRLLLSSSLLAPLLGLTAFEFWRGRAERLPSRWAVTALFTSMAFVFAVRIPLVGVAPFPFGALPAEPVWLGAFNIIILFHTILLAVLVVALTKERSELEQRNSAQTDALTGALNRRAFTSRGRRLVTRHQENATSLCVLFLDLDHFKLLNDQLGHSGGDGVLTKFVGVVHDTVRSGDLLFRMGGEEFCCLLPDTRADEALHIAERIRHQFEVEMVGAFGASMTVSIGLAATDTFGYDLDALVREADAAVYAAKRLGRNRVVIATADVVAGAGPRVPAANIPLAPLDQSLAQAVA